eukprot:gene9315-6554_t
MSGLEGSPIGTGEGEDGAAVQPNQQQHKDPMSSLSGLTASSSSPETVAAAAAMLMAATAGGAPNTIAARPALSHQPPLEPVMAQQRVAVAVQGDQLVSGPVRGHGRVGQQLVGQVLEDGEQPQLSGLTGVNFDSPDAEEMMALMHPHMHHTASGGSGVGVGQGANEGDDEEEAEEDDEDISSGYEEEDIDEEDETRSSSNSSSSGSSSGSGSDGDDGNDDEKETAKRYPLFTPQYATYCNYGMVPFLRMEEVPVVRPQGGASTAGGSNTSHHRAGSVVTKKQFVLYGEYVYENTLGKGTYSKVVLATPLRQPGAAGVSTGSAHTAAPQGSPGSSSSHGPSSSIHHLGCGGADAGGAPLDVPVALKIFRNKETYREACWDEMVILSLLCGLPAVPTMRLGGKVGGGMAEYTASLARFVAPISYIPHPMHPALVLPLMGPATLRVSRKVKQASRDIAVAEGYNVRESPRNKPAVWYRGLPLPLLKSVICQILIFLQYSHAKGIVHTDLKPENVLFESVHCQPAVIPVFYQELRRKCGDGTDTPDEEEEVHPTSSGAGTPTDGGNQRKTHAGDSDEAPLKMKARKQENEEQSFHANDSSGGLAATQVNRRRSMTSAGAAGSPVAAAYGNSNFPFFSFTPGGRDAENPAHRVRFAHNVTVKVPLLPSIRVVDLGAAQLISSFTHISRIDHQTRVSYDRIQTKHYISPEVLLCTGWCASADLFSLGCMIPELLTGDCLFMPQHRVEHLALMEHIIGPFSKEDTSKYVGSYHTHKDPGTAPRRFIDEAFICNPQNAEIDFDAKTKELRWPLTKKMVAQRASLVSQYERGYHNSDANSDDDEVEPSSVEDVKFVRQKATLKEILGPIPLLLDLCEKMLTYHPLERISPAEALAHPFFESILLCITLPGTIPPALLHFLFNVWSLKVFCFFLFHLPSASLASTVEKENKKRKRKEEKKGKERINSPAGVGRWSLKWSLVAVRHNNEKETKKRRKNILIFTFYSIRRKKKKNSLKKGNRL